MTVPTLLLLAATVASWYGSPYHGRKTASGEVYDMNRLTAAHRTLPFGTKVKVTYKDKSVVVEITDRGPFVEGRDIDLSRAAAEEVGMLQVGVAEVEMDILSPFEDQTVWIPVAGKK